VSAVTMNECLEEELELQVADGVLAGFTEVNAIKHKIEDNNNHMLLVSKISLFDLIGNRTSIMEYSKSSFLLKNENMLSIYLQIRTANRLHNSPSNVLLDALLINLQHKPDLLQVLRSRS